MVFRSRGKTVTETDMLCIDVGAVLEQGGYRGAVNVGKPGFQAGYHLIVNRRTVDVCYLDELEGGELIAAQTAFAERVLPMLNDRFGANRVTPKMFMGVRQGFRIALR